MYQPGAWDEFFENPAISFTSQPNLKSLYTSLASDKKVLLLLGAGVSMDAGLPDWPTLVTRIIEYAPDSGKRWVGLVRDDRGEPARKAEYVANMATEGGSRPLGGIIRDALYRAAPDPSPGHLADSIGRLVSLLSTRATVLTTNYDVLIERAIEAYQPSSSRVDSVSFRTSGRGQTPMQVVHLHGILEPGLEPIGDIVFTQSSFLRHQGDIQKFLADAIAECDVAIVVGMSITDPNILGPLWKAKELGDEAPEIYNFAVVGMSSGSSTVPREDQRAYAYRCAHFLEDAFEVRNIYLKTFAQLPQVIYDAALFMTDSTGYLEDDPNTSLRYGHRLNRCMDGLYSALGCEPDSDFPSGLHNQEVSDLLFHQLSWKASAPQAFASNGDPDEWGGIAQFLERCATRLKKSNDVQRRRIFEEHEAHFMSEEFALFLWLRSRNVSEAEHGIRLVGTSAYLHREQWSMNRSTEIVPNSGYPAVDCILDGKPFIARGYDPRPNALWGAIAATPFSITSTTASGQHAGFDMDVLQVGCITLNTNHDFAPRDKSRVDLRGEGARASRPVSILSFLDLHQQAELYGRLQAAAQRIVSPF